MTRTQKRLIKIAVKENVKFQKTGLSAKVERFKNKLKFLFS